MDKKIANNVVLGLFVGLGVLGFCFLIFNMGGGKGLFASHYTLYAKFQDVKGLHFGSEISLSGLRIGTVRNITVTSDESRDLLVQLSIDKKFTKSIREDSVATIRTQGVLGDKYIEVSIGSPEFLLLKDGELIKSHEEKDLLSRSGKLVEGIASQFQKGGNIDQVLLSVNALAENLNVVAKDIQKKKGLMGTLVYGDSGQDLKKSLSHLEGILRKINEGKGTIGAFVNDPTIYEDLKYLLGGAKRSSVLKYFLHQFVESGQEGEQSQKK